MSLDAKLKNSLELRVQTLNTRIVETSKLTTNETPGTIPALLYAILENQEEIMESLSNIQLKILLDNK